MLARITETLVRAHMLSQFAAEVVGQIALHEAREEVMRKRRESLLRGQLAYRRANRSFVRLPEILRLWTSQRGKRFNCRELSHLTKVGAGTSIPQVSIHRIAECTGKVIDIRVHTDINAKGGQTLNECGLVPRRDCDVREKVNSVRKSFIALCEIKAALGGDHG